MSNDNNNITSADSENSHYKDIMDTAINITDAYMESLYNLSDEEKINIATKLLNSLKGTFKNTVNASKKGNSTSFLDLKGVLSKDIDGNKLYDEYIEDKYGI